MKRSRKFYKEWTNDKDEKFGVDYRYEGSYYPQTREEPAEYPELVIDSFYRLDNNQEIEDIPDEVYNYINEHHDGDDE